MKRKTILSAVCALAFVPAMAQTTVETTTVQQDTIYSADKFIVETNRFWNNWFISAGVGAQVYFGDHDRQASFHDRLAPAAEIGIGKWFTPGIGVRLMYSGLQVRGATKHPGDAYEESAHGTGSPVKGGGSPHWLEKQKFNMGNIHADVLFNLSNLFAGYSPTRVWNCSPYLGLGYAMVYDSPTAYEVSANIGLLNSFRLSNALDINIDMRGMYVNDRFDGEGGGRFGEGMWSLTAGLNYKFGKSTRHRTWGRSKTVIRHEINNAGLNDLRAEVERLTAENANLKQTIANGNQGERTVVKYLASANLVTFKINKSKLSNEARANLGMLAEAIKKGDSSAVYTITGYADKGTGTPETNERLSRERAQNVYDCLVNEFGVDKNQLRMEYKGGVDNMYYDDPTVSRAVITRVQ